MHDRSSRYCLTDRLARQHIASAVRSPRDAALAVVPPVSKGIQEKKEEKGKERMGTFLGEEEGGGKRRKTKKKKHRIENPRGCQQASILLKTHVSYPVLRGAIQQVQELGEAIRNLMLGLSVVRLPQHIFIRHKAEALVTFHDGEVNLRE